MSAARSLSRATQWRFLLHNRERSPTCEAYRGRLFPNSDHRLQLCMAQAMRHDAFVLRCTCTAGTHRGMIPAECNRGAVHLVKQPFSLSTSVYSVSMGVLARMRNTLTVPHPWRCWRRQSPCPSRRWAVNAASRRRLHLLFAALVASQVPCAPMCVEF